MHTVNHINPNGHDNLEIDIIFFIKTGYVSAAHFIVCNDFKVSSVMGEHGTIYCTVCLKSIKLLRTTSVLHFQMGQSKIILWTWISLREMTQKLQPEKNHWPSTQTFLFVTLKIIFKKVLLCSQIHTYMLNLQLQEWDLQITIQLWRSLVLFHTSVAEKQKVWRLKATR